MPDKTAPTPTLQEWTYQPPRRPDSAPGQCYYRAGRFHYIAAHGDRLDYPQLTLFRFDTAAHAELTLDIDIASVKARLDPAQLTALRDALNDALHDIEQFEAERERRESFEAIQADLRDAEDRGESTGVLYAHPDVHYVAADQVEAKVAALEAAGAQRYMVLADPTREAA